MKNLEQHFPEDLSITKSPNSVRENSNSIPVDVLIDIFSRVVSVKSIARLRCVSKLWESVLRGPDFKELFLTKSLTRPRLFFILEVNDELVTFSAPQPQNPDDNSCVTATRYKSFPKHFPTHIYTQICGLVLLQSYGRKKRVICNTVTGESITLPKVKATGIQGSYLGFDPINKKFKVLCLTWSRYGWSRYGTPRTHQILALESGKRVWRKILHPLDPHDPGYDDEVCINGVLYYRSYYDENKIVCFDFRFEEFSLIELDKDMLCRHDDLTFFNYNGKLGAHRQYKSTYHGEKKLVLWVLEDAGEHKWSKRICQLPHLWDIVHKYNYKTVGTTGSGEIVFSPCWRFHPPEPFYILYYNIERNNLTRVNIYGFEEFKHHDGVLVDTSLDYVENMNFV